MSREGLASRARLRRRSIAFLFIPAIRGARGWTLIGLALQLFSGAFFALYPLGMRLLTDGVIGHKAHELVVGVIVTGAFMILQWAVQFLGGCTFFVIGPRADLYLSTRIAQLVNDLPGLEHFERPEYLAELETLSRDRRVLSMTAMQILNLFSISVRMIVMFILLTSVSPLFLFLPIAAFVPYFADAASARYRKRVDNALAETTRLTNRFFELATTTAPASELRTFGLRDEIAARRSDLAAEITASTSRAGLVTMATGVASRFVFAATFITLTIVAIDRAITGHASAGQVLMVLVLAQSVQQTIGIIAGNTGELVRARLTAERFLWLEDEAERSRAGEATAHPPGRLVGGITLDRVAFTYPGTDVPVLSDVSVHIPAGKSVAIVGDNGAGKSTLAKLLSRMYEPTSGSIAVDGVELDSLAIDEWRERITATYQDFARYQMRAGHAVGIGDLPQMEDDGLVLAALEDAGAETVLANFADGLDTQLGRFFAGGQELSGGEWQKVALGRGRMRRSPLLLILDEPTASLDPIAESTLFDHYVRAATDAGREFGTITLLVSHRFSTVRTADLILVLHDGRVAEFGSHAELMVARGRYADLFALQEQGYR